MRDIFEEIFDGAPADPMDAARRAMQPPLRQRFYARAEIGERGEAGFPVLLDGKLVRTPARRALAAPSLALAQAVAEEWNAQTDVFDPGRMPLTRLANAVIDTVTDATASVSKEVERYFGSDLVCYRADAPAELVARQSRAWDSVLAWAHEALGARFIQVEGVMFASQPDGAIAAARAAIPSDPWRLAAVSSITTLTGSALLALALAHVHLDVEAVWAAAHIDEDWEMEQWGRDEIALQRRAFRYAELEAAATVLRLMQ